MTTFPWTRKMRALAGQAAEILADKFGARAVWLFGSVARGNWGPDSDIDLLVILADSREPRYRRAQQAHLLLGEIAAPKDVIVLTQDEWDREQRAPASLVSAVRREGICLHGQGK